MRPALIFSFVLILIFAGARAWDRYCVDELRILFFDVGQGDSALLRFPGGKTMLIDAGGGTPRWNVGGRVLFPELTRFGILNLDYAVLTHPDSDHVRGFLGLLGQISIGELWMNRLALSGIHYRPLLGKILREASETGTSTLAVDNKRELEIGGAKISVFPLTGEGRNDSPLITLVAYRGCRILFTADIENEGENALARKLNQPIDLLKVAHHGSRTSSGKNFLSAARPQVSVMSVGGDNRYGHPHLDAVERLHSAGVDTLRTDFHGYVEFSIGHDSMMRCGSYHGNCGFWSCRDDV